MTKTAVPGSALLLRGGHQQVAHATLQPCRLILVDHALGSRFIEKSCRDLGDLLGFVEIVGFHRFSELAQAMAKSRFGRSIAIASNHTLTKSLFGSLGVWHLVFLLHFSLMGNSGEILPRVNLPIDLMTLTVVSTARPNIMPQRPKPVQSQLPVAAPQNTANLAGEQTSGVRRTGKLGKVALVGAGPGAPGLLTMRGYQCLQRADVVLFDGLANPQLLELAPQAQHISVGKHGQTPHWSQTDINKRLIELAAQGNYVVRLKGGDPAVFARTAEELDVLASSGIAFEVVPGITAALAAASYVGIPITHRQHASAVALVTGQQQSAAPPQPIDWDALARFPGTLVFYMGVTTVREWTGQLMAAGKPAETPAAIIRRCTWEDQQVLRCQLSEVAGHLTPASKMRPPVIVIVGAVAGLGDTFNWFANRPLSGCGVLITRPEHQSQELGEHLRELGARVYFQPVIELAPPQDRSQLQHAIESLVAASRPQGLTFSSRNGVEHFMQALYEAGYDARGLANTTLAGVGPSVSRALRSYGLTVDILPPAEAGYSARSLLAELRRIRSSLSVEQWWVTRCNNSRPELPRGLEELGWPVHEVLTYESHARSQLTPSVAAALADEQIHLCTITSSLIASAACSTLGDFRQTLRPVSFSQHISERLASMDWPAWTQATQHTTPALVEAIVEGYRSMQADESAPH